MTAPPPDVLDRLPHRPPFRFLTEVTRLTPQSDAAGSWVVTGDEPFLVGHFPDHPLVPGVLITEALAQLAGLIVGTRGDDGQFEGRLAQVDVRLTGAVHPPADIMLSATLTRTFGSVFQFEVEARHEGLKVASGTVVLSDASPRT